MKEIEQLQDWLGRPRRIAITTHQKPDGDAIGSSLGLYHYLIQFDHKVKIVVPTDYAENLKWLKGSDQIMIGPNNPEAANWTFEGSDIIFCLDFNALDRINEFASVVEDSEAKKVMVDHHLEPKGFDDLRFWDAEASSTAEMVYRMILAAGHKDKVTIDLAEALYMGLLTDTGSFRYTTTSPAVHQMASHLLEVGVDTTKVFDLIYSNSSENRLRFFGHCFTNCLHVLPELKTAYLKVDKSIFKQFHIKSGETEGLVNYALGLKDINLGVLMTEQDDLVKLSFRSRGSVGASEIAKLFGGGGHFYAAGGKSTESMDDTEKRFLEILEEKKDYLNQS